MINEKWMDPGQVTLVVNEKQRAAIRTNFHPDTGSPLVPVEDSKYQADDPCKQTVPVEEIEYKCNDYAYAGN